MDSHRVGSVRVQEAGNISGSGRVTIFVGRVGSDLEIWTRVQLCGRWGRRPQSIYGPVKWRNDVATTFPLEVLTQRDFVADFFDRN